MKKKAILTALFVILLIPSLNSLEKSEKASISIIFDIQTNEAVIENIDYVFYDKLKTESFEYAVGKRVKDIRVFVDNKQAEHEVIKRENKEVIVINTHEEEISKINISFVADDAIFKNSDILHFFTDVSFNPEIASKINARAILPNGYGLYEDSFKPEYGIKTTDGRRIIIEWPDLETKNPVFFSVKYQKLTGMNISWWIIIILLVIGLISLYFYHRKRVKRIELLGFREDEKKAIEYIKANKKVNQRDLQRQFNFSRVKATRIVKRLVEQGLINKEEFGRTNRLYWKEK